MISLLLVGCILYRVLTDERRACNAGADTFPVGPMILGSFILATLLHADMNSRPLFDALWMAGLFIGILAVLPQLWLVSRADGRIEALTSHYIAAMALSRLMSGTFMWHARFDITCHQWVEGFEHAVWAILAAHLLHLLLLTDFAY